jgi:hypothetical protein
VSDERYSKISRRMWADKNFLALSPSAKILWVYIITGPHGTAVPGLFVLGAATMAEAMGWTVAATRKALQEIGSRKDSDSQPMIRFDPAARLVWLPNALKHNFPRSAGNILGWKDAWRCLPECDLRDEAAVVLRTQLAARGAEFASKFVEITGISMAGSAPPNDTPQGTPEAPPEGGSKEKDQEKDRDRDTSGGERPAQSTKRVRATATDEKPKEEGAEQVGWRCWRELYAASPRKYGKYTSSNFDGKTMKALAVHAQAVASEHGGAIPPPIETVESLLRHWFAAYLADDGYNCFLASKRHALEYLQKDIPKYGSPWASGGAAAIAANAGRPRSAYDVQRSPGYDHAEEARQAAELRAKWDREEEARVAAGGERSAF